MDVADSRRSASAQAWRLSPLLAVLLLAACASVPLSTLWRMRDFDARSVQQLDPGALRAAIAIEPAAPPAADSVRLRLDLTRADGSLESHAFGLEPTREPGPPAAARRYSVWRLDAAGRDALAKVQRALGAAESTGGNAYSAATFAVNFRPDFGDAPPAAATLWVQLLLDDADGWLLLFDEAVIELESTG